jgi:hypothetical protein
MPRSASGRVEQQMQAVKLIKKDKALEPRAKIQFAMNQNKWSREVKTWISEFQKHRCGEPLPAFDCLFNSSVKSDGETLEKESL